MKNHIFLAAILMAATMPSCKKSSAIEAIHLYPVKNDKTFEYIDKEGKIVINPQFEQASIFRDGIALVETTGDNHKWGFIDESGKYVVNPIYKEATIFSEGAAWVISENTAPKVIDSKGNIKFTLQNAENVRIFKEGLAAFSEVKDSTGTKWGFVDKSGAIKITPQFASVGDFSNGKSRVSNTEGKYGYISQEGQIEINYQFDVAGNFEDGRAVAGSKDKLGVIGEDGKYIINPQFDEISIDGENYLIKKDGKYGWCDANGKIIINPQFEDASGFMGSKLAAVSSGKQYGYIDKEGKFIINPQFDSAYPFNDDVAMVESGNKIGFIDSAGKFVINPQFDHIALDFITALYGRTMYAQVSTDFFNVQAITSSISLSSPEGLSLDDNASAALSKLRLSSSELDKYDDFPSLIKGKKVGGCADVTLQMFGNPFYYPVYSYTKTFNPEFVPKGYYYEIKLEGRAIGKGNILAKAFQESASGMALVKKGFDKGSEAAIYKDARKQVVIINDNNTFVKIFIMRPDVDLSRYAAGLSGNSETSEVEAESESVPTEPDTTTVDY